MFSIEQAKQMAKRLRASLETRDQAVPHATALELVAQQLGYKDWNTASAMLPQESPPPAITFDKPIPILRMFDETKAREFYLDFLGFSVEFEHRFEADLPLYLGISPRRPATASVRTSWRCEPRVHGICAHAQYRTAAG